MTNMQNEEATIINTTTKTAIKNQLMTLFPEAGSNKEQVLVLLTLLGCWVFLTVGGMSNYFAIPWLGFVICMVCLFCKDSLVIDLWVLIPLLVYDLFALLAAWHTYDAPFPVEGFIQSQSIYTVAYIGVAKLRTDYRLALRTLCSAWIGCLAVVCVAYYVILQPTNFGGRLYSTYIGSPNVMGMLLVMSWFSFFTTDSKTQSLQFFEPIILAALGITLSMGSFLSLGVGLCVGLVLEWKRLDKTQAWSRFLNRIARIVVGVIPGVLIYLTVQRTSAVWLIVCLCGFLTFAAINWSSFNQYLRQYSRVAGLISAIGIACGVSLVLLRPGASGTFMDRLGTMANGMKYLFVQPALGVGPRVWRQLNAADMDVYYNVNEIHNLFIHVGVELGIPAMLALIVIAVRFFQKPGDTTEKAGASSYFTHALMDTTFFVANLTVMGILCFAHPQQNGQRLRLVFSRCLLGALAFFCVWSGISVVGGFG